VHPAEGAVLMKGLFGPGKEVQQRIACGGSLTSWQNG
jgi:hypothetical protein